jgi:hypothetical protein
MASRPPSAPPSARPRDEPVIPGFEFDRPSRPAGPPGPEPLDPDLFGADPFRAYRSGAGPFAADLWADDDVFAGEYSPPAPWVSAQTGPIRAFPPGRPGPAGPRPTGTAPARSGPVSPGSARPALRGARREWSRLLRSFLPEPARRHWLSDFRSALRFRGLAVRVAIPILVMIVLGVAVVVIAGANSGHSGPAPPPASLGFPPATLAGSQFAAAAGGRGVSQTLGHVASDGPEIVAVGSQVGARIARAQFFVSLDDGRSWSTGSPRAPGGGPPPPGHAAALVAGSRGAWVAIGPGSIWTSTDGRTWTLSSTTGLPLRPGDQINVLKRAGAGFIAAGANVPGGDQAHASPVVFLSANGITWQRLGAGQLGLPVVRAPGINYRALDIRYAAAYRNQILIAGDVAATETSGRGGRAVTVRTSAAWLSHDGGTTWALAVPPGAALAGHGARAQISGEAATGDGFILLRPAAAGGRPAVDVYRSPNGTAWTFAAALGTPVGFVAGMASGGPDGAAVTGQAGGILTVFSSADGASWRRTPAYGSAASQATTGVTVAAGGVVVTAGTTTSDPDSRRPLITVLGPQAAPDHVDVAALPGAAQPELAVNGIAAADGRQVVVGSANGYPAVWTSADGGSSWTRAVGQPPAALNRPGVQQLASVTHGAAGWLAVGGVTAVAAQHPVVVGSANGIAWQAADGEAAFSQPGLSTEQAAAGPGGYVIVGYQVVSGRMVAAAWWSAGLTGWHRAGGALRQSQGAAQMMAVTAASHGFVAVGAAGNQPAAWISPDGRNWNQRSLPLPVGATMATLQQVASHGRVVAAVGTALITTGLQVPFAARSSDGGVAWTESALPVPSGRGFVTALAAAGRGFVATGTFGSTPGHQDVVVWTSADGSAWTAVAPAGQGLTGPGIQAITALTASGSTLTGVGFTASPAGEQPVFWQSPIR